MITNNNNSMIRLNNRIRTPLRKELNEANVISLRISQKEVKMWERMRRPNILNNSSKGMN